MKLGFIGCGNMAKAMIGGIVKNGIFKADEIIASDAFRAGLEKAGEELGINITSDNAEVVAKAEVIVLAIKPQFYDDVLKEITAAATEQNIFVTIAPGYSLEKVAGHLGSGAKIIRTMPNTPALVGEGVTAVSPNSNITEDELAYVCNILSGFGSAEVIPERLMDAVVAVSGSSPAYVFMFIEAMADGAVAEGMPRNQAYKFAAQAVLGSAKMVLETGKHPGELKDMVCSPGGTTIQAVKALERTGLRSSVMEGMQACLDKARNM